MSAADNLSHYQLSMFMPAHQLADNDQTLHFDDGGGELTTDELRDWKIEEAMEGGEFDSYSPARGQRTLYDSIQSDGVRAPVFLRFDPSVSKPSLRNGHHRVFAAEHIDPQMEIPVEWGSDVGKGRR